MSSTRRSSYGKYSHYSERFLFTPLSSAYKSSVQKGRDFEDYFERGVKRAWITAKVGFQKTLTVTPRSGDKRRRCRPDAIFTKGSKGAIVEIKNYEASPLRRSQVDKTYKDMCALKEAYGCRQVDGYIYVRNQTTVTKSAKYYAEELGIFIIREGEIDADELAELVDRNLKI